MTKASTKSPIVPEKHRGFFYRIVALQLSDRHDSFDAADGPESPDYVSVEQVFATSRSRSSTWGRMTILIDLTMRLGVASLLLATVAEASPKCASPRIHTHRSLAAAKDSLKSRPPQAAPDLADHGTAFFVDVPLGSPNGSDNVNYRVAAIIVRKDTSVVVVDDLAHWTSVLPPPGHKSPVTPAQSIRLDGTTAHLKIDGFGEALVDVAGAKFLGCVK